MVGERDIVGEWSMDVADVAKVGAKVKWQWIVCVNFYAPEKIICAWMGGGGSGRLRRAFPIVSKEVGNTWDRETRPRTHLASFAVVNWDCSCIFGRKSMIG